MARMTCRPSAGVHGRGNGRPRSRAAVTWENAVPPGSTRAAARATSTTPRRCAAVQRTPLVGVSRSLPRSRLAERPASWAVAMAKGAPSANVAGRGRKGCGIPPPSGRCPWGGQRQSGPCGWTPIAAGPGDKRGYQIAGGPRGDLPWPAPRGLGIGPIRPADGADPHPSATGAVALGPVGSGHGRPHVRWAAPRRGWSASRMGPRRWVAPRRWAAPRRRRAAQRGG